MQAANFDIENLYLFKENFVNSYKIRNFADRFYPIINREHPLSDAFGRAKI